MLTDREKWLLSKAFDNSDYYKNVEQWLGEVISDAGHTVEMHIAHDAELYFNADGSKKCGKCKECKCK